MPIPVPASGLIFNFQQEFIRSDLEFSNESISLATGVVKPEAQFCAEMGGVCQ